MAHKWLKWVTTGPKELAGQVLSSAPLLSTVNLAVTRMWAKSQKSIQSPLKAMWYHLLPAHMKCRNETR